MNIIYFVPNITIAGGIFRIVSDKMNYLAENMEERLFLAYYGNGQEKPVYPLHPNIQLLPIDYKPQNKMFHFCKTFCSKITLVNTIQNVI